MTTSEHNPHRYESKEARHEAALALLTAGLDHVAEDPETLAAYLHFRAHFRSYSLRNTLLLQAQRPGARYCMGFQQWNAHGRRVLKGQKGLLLFVPRFRKLTDEEAARQGKAPGTQELVGFAVGYVFDISQTEVIPGCEETALRYASPIPQLEGDDFAHLYDELKEAAHGFGIAVLEDAHTTMEGYCSPGRRLIGIRRSLTLHSKAATLAHELAHALAHARPAGLSHEVRELQAEGAAFLACYVLGLDTSKAALPYLKHYEREGAKLEEHLEAIDRIAWLIVGAVERVREAAKQTDTPAAA